MKTRKNIKGMWFMLVALCAAALNSFADTMTWTASASGNWSTANWVSSGVHTVPQPGDTIVINATAAGLTLNNDISGLSTPHLEVSVSSGTLTLTGNDVTLTGGENAVKARSGNIINKMSLVLTVQNGNPTNKFNCAGGRIDQYGNVSGAGKLVKTGSAIMILYGGNTYTGGTVLEGPVSGNNWLDMWSPEPNVWAGNPGNTPFGDSSGVYEFKGASTRVAIEPCPYNCNVSPEGKGSVRDFWIYSACKNFTGNITGSRLMASLDSSAATVFSGNVTIDGDVNMLLDMGGTNPRQATFSGRVTCDSFNNAVNPSVTPTSADIYFSGSGNSIGSLYANFWNYYARSVNAFGTSAVVYLGQRQRGRGTLDLGGYDQRIDRFADDPRYPANGTASDFAGHVVTSTGGSARLTMAATDDCTTDAMFDGALTLAWNPQGAYTFRTSSGVGRAMGMTGGIVVSNGTFEVNGTNSFPKSSFVEVADGAAFEWKSTCVGKGLSGMARLSIGAGATFSVADGASFPLVDDEATTTLSIDLAETARLVLRDGDTLAACTVSTNGVPLDPFTTYTGVYGAEDAIYLPQLAGSTARLKVFSPKSSGMDARVWTAGGTGTSMSLAANWNGEGAPNLYDGTLVPTFASAGSAATFDSFAFLKNVIFDCANDFTVSSASGGRVCLFGGVTTAARSGATYTIASPVTIMDGQTWTVAEGTTLKITGGLSAPASGDALLVAKDGSGTLELRGDSALTSNFAVTNGNVDVYGDIAGTGEIMLYKKGATLRMHGADIEKKVVVRADTTATITAIDVAAGTTNRLAGGLGSLRGFDSGMPVLAVALGGQSQLSVEKEFLNFYWNVSGNGDLVVENCPNFNVACLFLENNARMYLRQRCFTSGIPNYITIRRGTTLYTEANDALNRAPLELQGCLDLCGKDQTMGRMSWVSETNADGSIKTLQTAAEIRSDEPATLTVRHDSTSGSGSNRGMQIYAGKISGQVSLVKTGGTQNGNTTPDVQDLFLANAMTSTGDVSVVWGLLSFTNNVVYGGNTYSGSWTNCTAARVESTVDGLGNQRAGVLELCHSKALGRRTDVYVSGGGKVRLSPGVFQRVRYLYLPTGENGAYEQQPVGTYGSSSASGAAHRLDDYFEGTGVLYCAGDHIGTIISVW